MQRLLLIGFSACAFGLAPTLSASAMPGAYPKAPADSSIVLVKGGHGPGGGHGWGRGHGHQAFGWSHGRKVGWRGRGCPPGLWKQGRC